MPKLDFTPEELKELFTGKKYHHYRDDAISKEAEMRVHSSGSFPEDLIDCRRPNEPEEVLAYRKTIFVPKTKPYFNKIESTLQKIRRSTDWSIKYGNYQFDRVVDGEKLDDYAERNYPVFQSVTNWAFSLLLRNYLVDANAVLLVAPIEIPLAENEYLKPVATIFSSNDVIFFEQGNYAVLKNKLGVVGAKPDWESYYIVTTQYIRRYDQINNRKQFGVAYEYVHGLDELPAFHLGGIVVDVYGMNTLYESRISGILPEFNESLREYSDLQAAKVLHLYPERWEYTQNECDKCNGTGRRMEGVGESACQVTCGSCNGGYIASGPYSKLLVKPAAADQLSLPTPPAGFVEKDVEIIKVQEQSVQDHIYNGLASINFEFLASTPLNQSGTAKEVDKDELNNTVHAIAEDLIRIIDLTYYFISLYRYGYLYSKDEIKEMLPKIAVPEKFDILSAKYFDDQITSAKANKLNPAILNAMEVTYATKAFNNDGEIAEFVSLVLKLDPLAGIQEDDKMSRLSNNGITMLDYIVSSNINKFVNAAIEMKPDFSDLPLSKQKELVYAMAQDQSEGEVKQLLPATDDNLGE